MRACHGKRGPLAPIIPSDGAICFSASEAFRGAAPCQAFRAIGSVQPGDPYKIAMSEDFRPYRWDVADGFHRVQPSTSVMKAPQMSSIAVLRCNRNIGFWRKMPVCPGWLHLTHAGRLWAKGNALEQTFTVHF
jgi:hypothetical protein